MADDVICSIIKAFSGGWQKCDTRPRRMRSEIICMWRTEDHNQDIMGGWRMMSSVLLLVHIFNAAMTHLS